MSFGHARRVETELVVGMLTGKAQVRVRILLRTAAEVSKP